jgi:hypothetical protein
MTLPRELTLVRAVAVAVLLLALAATPAMASPCTADGETLCGDGGQATAARLLRPAAVATFPGGGLLVADTGNNAIRRVLPDGRVFTVAGIGTPGSAGDGGSAVAAQLNQPADVWAAANGTILVADAGSNKVRLISPTGAIMTVAGSASGSAGRAPSTTPSPATSVRLANPQGVAGVRGGFLIADTDANVILGVSADRRLRVIAGTGVAGNAGDGGPATAATLNAPTRVLPTTDGGYDILDLGNRRVRHVSPAGIITAVPGSDVTVVSDATPTFDPGGLARDAQGNLFVSSDRQVVLVDRAGVRTVVAGTNECGSTGDGGPAIEARLEQPAGLALTRTGDLLVADLDDAGSAAGNVRLIRRSDRLISTVAGHDEGSGFGACVGAGGSPSGVLWPIFYITAPRSAKPSKPITISFVTTRGAPVRASLLKGAQTVRSGLWPARPGLNKVTLKGVKRGAYTMHIQATASLPNNNADAGGQVPVVKAFQAALSVKP